MVYVSGFALLVEECAHRTGFRLNRRTFFGERATLVRKTLFHIGHKEIDIVDITSSRCRVKFYGSEGTHWGCGVAGIVNSERGIESHCE